jgi:hypothetical protein
VIQKRATILDDPGAWATQLKASSGGTEGTE